MERKLALFISGKYSLKFKIICIAAILLSLAAEFCPQRYRPGISEAAEAIEAEYYGSAEAGTLISSLNYTDVARSTGSSKEAVYRTGALGIVKGPSGKQFGRTAPVTKAEAVAIAYRAAGREAEAQQLGTALNNSRSAANRKTDPREVLYDGFLQLAANEGLITAGDLADAFNTDQQSLPDGSFKRNGAAQRREMAYWLALALSIPPVYQQQEILKYTDWRSTGPDELPYMEAVLREGIMSGSAGRLNPVGAVTREQAAQIIENAESGVLAANGYIKNTGTVESIETVRNYAGNTAVSARKITVRNADGRAAAIYASAPAAGASGTGGVKELVVYKNGALGDSSLLEKGDRLEYIADVSNTVKYVDVISNTKDSRYIAVEVNSVDSANLQIDVTELFELDYPDLKSITGDTSFSDGTKGRTVYRVSASAPVFINGEKSQLGNVTGDATAILTIGGGNIVNEIQCVDIGINSKALKIVRGIVEENNPSLGYITLYNEDGSGTSASGRMALRTYNYADPNGIEILRNHKQLKSADSIQAGDTAYIKLDDDGGIASISAVDNYTVKYGRILSHMSGEIAVEYEDGSQQVLPAGNNVIVIKDKLLAGLKVLKDGDRVRLLLNENGSSTDLKEITIEDSGHYISNIYKGKITKIDEMSQRITVLGLQSFNKGRWERTDTKGFTTIPTAENLGIYSGDTVLDAETADRLLYSNEAYIAVEKGYGGEEEAVLLSYRNSEDTAAPTRSDKLTDVITGSDSFLLARENRRVNFTEGSIVVKYGRLVSGNSLANDDTAYLALDRDYEGGDYYASVIQVDEPQNASGLVLYRGRISDINEEQDFTLESFSQLKGTDWAYANTPKTFNITMSTRVLIDAGVLNVREFTGYGDESYIKRTVYVLADGTDAVLVSTAPFGSDSLKGTVYRKDRQTLELRNVRVYNPSTFLWDDGKYATINVLENSIIIKDGKTAGYQEISKGTAVRVLKNGTGTTGDGYILFIE